MADDLDSFANVMHTLASKVVPIGVRVISQSLAAIQRRVQIIPPETDANKRGRKDADGKALPYYERNAGMWHPVKKIATLGAHPMKSTGAIKLTKKKVKEIGVVGYKLGDSSEQSSRRWKIEVTPGSEGNVSGELRNEASYSGYVFGHVEQDPAQAEQMTKIGWTSIDLALANASGAIDQILNAGADEVVKLIVNG